MGEQAVHRNKENLSTKTPCVNTQEKFIDLHLTTINGAGQEATFIKEKAFHIGTLPLALDESENKP